MKTWSNPKCGNDALGFLILCMEFFSQEIEKSGKCERKFEVNGEIKREGICTN